MRTTKRCFESDAEGTGGKSKAATATDAADTDTAPPQIAEDERKATATRLIAGIGASADSLDAFKRFPSTCRRSPACACPRQHLEPHHKSLLAELPGCESAMPVVEAEDGAWSR